MKLKKSLLLIPLVGVLLTGCQKQEHNTAHSASNQASSVVVTSNRSTNDVNKNTDLANLPTYQSGENAIVQINQGKSTLDPNSWKTNHVEYSQLDRLNRTSSPATAYLEQRNVANDNLREAQTVKPTGWHQKFDDHHNAILNRGHLIAYSLSKGIDDKGNYDPSQQSGDQNNIRNLFTQTAFSNQKLQTIYETKVRDALKEGKKVIYQVQPIFKGSDLMPYGVHLQAISTDDSLNFNVFIYNVQPGYIFDYQTGTSRVDKSMTVPTNAASPNFSNDSHKSYHRTYHRTYRHRNY